MNSNPIATSNRRTLLRSKLTQAWCECIKADYRSQRINSERSLQASFWSKLNPLLPSETRRLFIEPTMKIAVSKPNGQEKDHLKYPDIVVCNTRQIIGIVELKYQPRTGPTWKKDIATFKWISQHRNKISVSNVRFQGVEVDGTIYSLANDALFVWAGIHTPYPHRIGDQVSSELRQNFFELHADTHTGGEPAVW